MLKEIAQPVGAVVAAEDVHAPVVNGAGVEVTRRRHVTCILGDDTQKQEKKLWNYHPVSSRPGPARPGPSRSSHIYRPVKSPRYTLKFLNFFFLNFSEIHFGKSGTSVNPVVFRFVLGTISLFGLNCGELEKLGK